MLLGQTCEFKAALVVQDELEAMYEGGVAGLGKRITALYNSDRAAQNYPLAVRDQSIMCFAPPLPFSCLFLVCSDDL
jgi:hypothetical protein